MRSLSVVFVTLCLSIAALSSGPHDNTNVARHSRLSSRIAASSLVTRADKAARKCRKAPRVQVKTPVEEKKPAPPPAEPKKTNNNKSSNGNENQFTGGGAGLLKASGACGASGATKVINQQGGPNGRASWLTCGIESGGWKPPFVRIQDLVTVPLGQALQDPGSPFHACAKFKGLFEQYGNQFGIPPIMLTAFALQESSCNPETVGGGGEQGLMQITQEKCGGAPGGNCRTPWFNIMTAARYFKQTLDEVGGNVIIAVGRYNGWTPGLTVQKATAARYSNCCACQNNLDYLHEYFNGWLQNRDAYKHSLGTYNNLDVCPGRGH